MDDEQPHKYLASYMIDAWRERGGNSLVPATVKRECYCDSPEVAFIVGGQEQKFFFGRTPFNDPAAEKLISDKWVMYQTLGDEIPLPYTEFIEKQDPRSDASIRDSVLAKIHDPEHPFSFPLIVKPSEGSLSRNVYLARDPAQLERAIIINRLDIQNGPGILFQEYLGDDHGLFREIRGICLDGQTMIAYDRTTQQIIPEDVVTDPAHWPGVMRNEVNDPAIVRQINDIAHHLYQAYGVSYVAFDMKCDRNGKLWVLEGNVAPLGLDDVEQQMSNGQQLIKFMTARMLDKVIHDHPAAQLQMAASLPTSGGPQFF